MNFYPTKEEIDALMKQGAEAFLKGDGCPYSPYTEEGRLWLKGYANARFSEVVK